MHWMRNSRGSTPMLMAARGCDRALRVRRRADPISRRPDTVALMFRKAIASDRYLRKAVKNPEPK